TPRAARARRTLNPLNALGTGDALDPLRSLGSLRSLHIPVQHRLLLRAGRAPHGINDAERTARLCVATGDHAPAADASVGNRSGRTDRDRSNAHQRNPVLPHLNPLLDNLTVRSSPQSVKQKPGRLWRRCPFGTKSGTT